MIKNDSLSVYEKSNRSSSTLSSKNLRQLMSLLMFLSANGPPAPTTLRRTIYPSAQANADACATRIRLQIQG